MSTTTFDPPEALKELPDLWPTLVLPFGEAIAEPNDHAGLSYEWGDLVLPRREVPVDVLGVGLGEWRGHPGQDHRRRSHQSLGELRAGDPHRRFGAC
jgi:hypothetical protein